MYSLPQLYGTGSYLIPVEEDKVETCESECEFRDEYPCDKDIFELSLLYMESMALTEPTNAEEATELYRNLRRETLEDLWFIDSLPELHSSSHV